MNSLGCVFTQTESRAAIRLCVQLLDGPWRANTREEGANCRRTRYWTPGSAGCTEQMGFQMDYKGAVGIAKIADKSCVWMAAPKGAVLGRDARVQMEPTAIKNPGGRFTDVHHTKYTARVKSHGGVVEKSTVNCPNPVAQSSRARAASEARGIRPPFAPPRSVFGCLRWAEHVRRIRLFSPMYMYFLFPPSSKALGITT